MDIPTHYNNYLRWYSGIDLPLCNGGRGFNFHAAPLRQSHEHVFVKTAGTVFTLVGGPVGANYEQCCMCLQSSTHWPLWHSMPPDSGVFVEDALCESGSCPATIRGRMGTNHCYGG